MLLPARSVSISPNLVGPSDLWSVLGDRSLTKYGEASGVPGSSPVPWLMGQPPGNAREDRLDVIGKV